MDIVVRRAVSSELAALARYDSHIGREALLCRIQDGFVFSLSVSGQLVGVLRWNLLWQLHPFVELLFLDPRERGRGAGRIFVFRWEAAMRAKGYRYALTSTQEDETARFFWEKMGYERCGSFFPPEQAAAELVYRKKL